MATKVDIAGTDITASQMSEFYRLAALPGSHVNRGTFQPYLERRNPFAFEKNEHGHVVLTFTGLDITGAEEIVRFEGASYRVSNFAKSCFLSTREDSYDLHHRLEAGRIYKAALMPGREIGRDADRTTANLRKRGMKHYGYGKPLAGFIPRVRENLSDKQMEELGIWYAAALHEPITDSDGHPGVLDADRHGGGQWVDASWVEPGDQWFDDGAFVFPVAAS
jgi:hypothetical protein